MTVVDMHVHTTVGSSDSELSPSRLVHGARRMGLDAACITEHDKIWELKDAQALSHECDFPFLRGMEVTTDLGHILVFGLDIHSGGVCAAKDLRKTVNAAGGFMIAAHPFRRLLHQPPWGNNGGNSQVPTVEEASSLPIFEVVDEIEVLNGATNELENFLALRVAKKLGFKGTGGSDAHSLYGLGRYVTVFQDKVKDVGSLIHELKEGRFYAGEVSIGQEEREIVSYGDGMTDEDLEFRIGLAVGLDQ